MLHPRAASILTLGFGLAVPVALAGQTPRVEVTEDVLVNTTWTSDRVWVLTRPIFVGRDCGPSGSRTGCLRATLTIEPGTTIVGRTDLPSGVRGAYLVVNRGSRIVADATSGEDRPPTAYEAIVFTSDQPRGSRDRGDWGGLIINGRASTNAGAEALGEGESGLYGGNDDLDSSGILRGVRIEFAGDRVTPTDELNGLTLQGVGAGTTVSYIQVHHAADDGIEPFGGTVSVDHLVVTGIGDDSVDGTDGYRGFIQFIVGQQRGDEADNGMELSGNGEDDGSVTPRSTAVIANATMIGADEDLQTGPIAGPNSDRGIEFREASNYRVYNSIFTDFGDAGFCVSNARTEAWADNRLAGETDPQSTISFEGNILWNNADTADPAGDLNFEACIQDDPTWPGQGGYTQDENKAFFTAGAFNNLLADPLLDPSYGQEGEQGAPPAILATAIPDGYTPFDLGTIAFDGVTLVEPTDGRRLARTAYPGAVEPGTAASDAWYTGWTVWRADGADSRDPGAVSSAPTVSSVSVPDLLVDPGESLAVPVTVALAGPGDALGSVQAVLRWDPAVLAFAEVRPAPEFQGVFQSNVDSAGAGVLRFAGLNTDPLANTGATEVAVVGFEVRGETGTESELVLELENLALVDLTDLTGVVPVRSGAVRVGTGRWGDTDGDQVLSALDALACLTALVGRTVDDLDVTACDTLPDVDSDGDGVADAFDGTLSALDGLAIVRFALGLPLPPRARAGSVR